MKHNKLTPDGSSFPSALLSISSPPKVLYHAGANLNELLTRPRVAIVGSRAVTPYGRQVTEQLTEALAKRGVVIISGLALGVDGIAHHAALSAGGLTIAVLPGPVDEIAPAAHRQLAEEIVRQGGALVSEYAAGEPALKQNFVARNRLVAGLSQAVLITEAGEKSGSLHTAKFATQQGKAVLAVPGNVTSPASRGANGLLKTDAQPVTDYRDVLTVLGLKDHRQTVKELKRDDPIERRLIELMLSGLSSGDELLKASGLAISDFNRLLIKLELDGIVRTLGANRWTLR